MVPFAPWRLLLTLKGLNLSTSGVAALMPFAATPGEDSAEVLLVPGDPYDLQLEHDEEHLPAPLARTRLVRRARTSAGWELAFAFEGQDVSLLGLIHELGMAAAAARIP